MNVSDTLNLAADLIEERGWTKGGDDGDPWGEAPGTPLCIEGGIMAALGLRKLDVFGTPKEEQEFRTCPAFAAVAEHIRLTYRHLYAWNDAPERTANEVVEVLRATALIEATRERETAEVSA